MHSFGTDRVPIQLSSDLIERLTSLSRREDSTLFMTLLAGFKALLLGETGHNDICVGTAMANRTQPVTARVIGLFENTTLIRTRIDKNRSFQDLLQKVRDSVLAAHEHQELPFVTLAKRLEIEDNVDLASLLQVYFAIQNPIRRQLNFTDVTVSTFGDPHREGQPVLPIDRTKLTLMLKETSSGIMGSCIYNGRQFGPGVIERLVSKYVTILIRAASEPEAPVGRLAAHEEL